MASHLKGRWLSPEPGTKLPLTVAEIVDFGRTTFAQRLEQGSDPTEALVIALEASIAAERTACVLTVQSWEDLAKRHGEIRGDWVVHKIVENLLGDA